MSVVVEYNIILFFPGCCCLDLMKSRLAFLFLFFFGGGGRVERKGENGKG